MYRSLTRLTSLLMVGLGLAMLVVTAVHGGGVGLILGPLFMVAGCGRLLMLRRRA
jgi:hypothetical protein